MWWLWLKRIHLSPSAVQWWEEWQLRVLALCSLGVQCYLALFASARKANIRPLFRFFIWLAYVSGDTLAMYALAMLFNRQSKVHQHQYCLPETIGNRDLEVLWAPILLMHLGGQINISAYNIEDNELWRRHILTALGQVVVALYVFCKSWSFSADTRLFVTAILLFIIGVVKCLEKPIALRRASFNAVVRTFRPDTEMTEIKGREVALEEYIQRAIGIVKHNQPTPTLNSRKRLALKNKLLLPDKLFVDYSYSLCPRKLVQKDMYLNRCLSICKSFWTSFLGRRECVHDDRLTKLKSFWSLDKDTAYMALCEGLSRTFDLFYTRLIQMGDENRAPPVYGNAFSGFIAVFNVLFPIVPIGLFHTSHRQAAYRGSDIKVTFVLLYVTYFVELLSIISMSLFDGKWSDEVAQHSLIGSVKMYYCGFKPCRASKDITMLVRGHVEAGWTRHIEDIESYWRFNDTRGQRALEHNRAAIFQWSIEKPFDESVILWHVATDFCFHSDGATSPASELAKMCRQISNYMMHLLFANPEMLLPGSRKKLFTVAYLELKKILKGDRVCLFRLDEKELTQKIIEKVKLEGNEGFFKDSWRLAQGLMNGLTDEETMWNVIRDVWVEMLCFSAGRCRGYLHAKSIGSGGEYLNFVSLLMSHAGLETFAEKQQRVQLQLEKEVRVRIATQRVQEAGDASNQPTECKNHTHKQPPCLFACFKNRRSTKSSTTPQGIDLVMNREESTTTQSAPQVNDPLHCDIPETSTTMECEIMPVEGAMQGNPEETQEVVIKGRGFAAVVSPHWQVGVGPRASDTTAAGSTSADPCP